MRALALAALGAVVSACPPEVLPQDAGNNVPCTGCDLVCPTGFVALDGGAGCVLLRTISSCPPGSMPRLGTTDCTPVGVRSCPVGFVADSSGWGCRDVISAVPCTGATREKLGSATCVPVGDCAAAFPPPGATHFVSAAYTAGQLDSTHFDTIVSALAAADAGSIIAIDEGAYAGNVNLPRPMTLWGKCPERVSIVNLDAGTNIGLRMVDVGGSMARGITVRGFPAGVAVAGGSVLLEGMVIEGNTITGMFATNGGTQATLRDSVVRGQRARPADRQASGAYAQRGAVLTLEEVSLSDNEFVGAVTTNPDAGLIIRRSVIRDTFPIAQGPVAGTFGVGVYSVDAAWLHIEESVVLNSVGEGVLVARGGTRPASGSVFRSVVRDTQFSVATDNAARGIEVGNQATLHVEECTVTGNAEHEILVTEEGRATIVNTTTVGSTNLFATSGTGMLVAFDGGAVATSLAVVRGRAVGVGIDSNGHLELVDSFITEPVLAKQPNSTGDAQALGISMKPGGQLVMKGGMIHRASGVGLVLSTARATLDGTAIVDTQTRYGLGGRAVSVQDQSVFIATNSALVGNHEAAIITFDPGSVASLTNSSLEESKVDDFGNFGIGALATTGSSLELNSCTVTRSSAIGVAASDAQVAVRASFLSFNETGVHGQDGVSVATSSQVVLTPNVLGVSDDTRFIGNGQTTGFGTVALPSK